MDKFISKNVNSFGARSHQNLILKPFLVIPKCGTSYLKSESKRKFLFNQSAKEKLYNEIHTCYYVQNRFSKIFPKITKKFNGYLIVRVKTILFLPLSIIFHDNIFASG